MLKINAFIGFIVILHNLFLYIIKYVCIGYLIKIYVNEYYHNIMSVQHGSFNEKNNNWFYINMILLN